MTLLVLSDIHGNQEALDAILKDFMTKYSNRLLCDSTYVTILGDTIDYGADSVDCVNRIFQFCNDYDLPLFTVRGNHENAVLYGSLEGINTPHGKDSVKITMDDVRSHISEFRMKLCPYLILEFLLPANSKGLTLKVKMTHSGNPHNPLTGNPEFIGQYVWSPDSIIPKKSEVCYDIITEGQFNVIPASNLTINLFGHSHIPYFKKTDRYVYFNPGSVGQPRDGDPRASYGVIEEDDSKLTFNINRVNYDIEEASRKIAESGRAPKLYLRLFEGK